MCKSARMENFNDFCEWAGSQRKAADLLGVSEATVSRWAARGRVPTVEAAELVESVSKGRFSWVQMIRTAPKPEAA